MTIPRRSAAEYRRSVRNGLYAGSIPLVTKSLAGSEPPQSGGVLNPLANKQEFGMQEFGILTNTVFCKIIVLIYKKK